MGRMLDTPGAAAVPGLLPCRGARAAGPATRGGVPCNTLASVAVHPTAGGADRRLGGWQDQLPLPLLPQRVPAKLQAHHWCAAALAATGTDSLHQQAARGGMRCNHGCSRAVFGRAGLPVRLSTRACVRPCPFPWLQAWSLQPSSLPSMEIWSSARWGRSSLCACRASPPTAILPGACCPAAKTASLRPMCRCAGSAS